MTESGTETLEPSGVSAGCEVHRFDAAVKTEEELQAAQEILAGVFTYERIGYDQRAMGFQKDGTVGVGVAGRELFWDLRRMREHLVLELASKTEVTCRLIRDETGVWRGKWFCAEQMPIALYSSKTCILNDTECEVTSQVSRAPAIKVGIGGLFTREYEARIITHDRGSFAKTRNAKVLIYFRHGLGDWVTLSYILPLLDRSNRYWITRFGDDYTSVMQSSDYVTPIYLGSNTIQCGDGKAYHNQHFGMDLDLADGSTRIMNLPLSLHDACVRNEIDTVLHLSYPEIHGWNNFPYHSKARFMIPYLVDVAPKDQERLGRPLPSAINFAVDPWISEWVQSRLRNVGGFGDRKLCLISRTGYTAHGKNWGHKWREDMPPGQQREGEECRDFMRLMLRKDSRWMFLIMEDILFHGDDTLRSEELHAYSFAELFGSVGQAAFPFGIVVKALLNVADLSIGVPTGPFHLSIAKPELPTIGIWLEHLPSWYDEPKPNSLNLIGRAVREAGMDRRPGSFTDKDELHFPTRQLDTRIVTGIQVMEAVETLLY